MAKQKDVALADKPSLEILNEFIVDRNLEEAAKGEAGREAEKIRLLNGLERVIAYIPTNTEYDRKGSAVVGFITEYVSLMFREKYPQVSGELLSLKRSSIDVNCKADGYYDIIHGCIDIPVFVYARFGKDEQWEKKYTVKSGDGTKSAEITLSSKTPTPTLEVRKKAKEAIAYCHDLESKVLQIPVIGDVLLAQRINGKAVPHPADAELYVLWKPKPSELKTEIKQIIDPDPILTIAWQNRLYLVTTWQVAEEEPFMHYLKEFKL